MDTNEIMNNEVIETTEEIVKTSSGKALKVAGGIGLAVIAGVAGVVAYKYIVKPMVDKRKVEKEETAIYEADAVVVEDKDSEGTDK